MQIGDVSYRREPVFLPYFPYLYNFALYFLCITDRCIYIYIDIKDNRKNYQKENDK